MGDLSTACIEDNILEFNPEQIKYHLNKTLDDNKNDLVKKMVLFEFIKYFNFKEEYDEMMKILNEYNAIREEVPLSK